MLTSTAKKWAILKTKTKKLVDFRNTQMALGKAMLQDFNKTSQVLKTCEVF